MRSGHDAQAMGCPKFAADCQKGHELIWGAHAQQTFAPTWTMFDTVGSGSLG